VVGDALYIVGGSDDGGPLGSVERASIDADGTLSSFATVAGVALTTARAAHTSVVAGNSLYIIGGDDGVAMSSVERASLDAGGALSGFGAVSGVTLATPRAQHATVVAGDSLYLIGGFNGGTLDSVERATIGADGALSSFVTVPGLVLAQARYGHSAAVIGSTLYVIGGSYGFPVLGSVEQTTIGADGSLSGFVTVPGVVLVTPRNGHTSVVVGDALYVLGGSDATGTAIDSVERATINADGSLSTFATVAGGALASARDGHSSAVIGDSLFVAGGLDTGGNLVTALERATINTDGSLSSFATVASVDLATPRYLQSSVVAGSSLYIVGGSQGAGEILDSVEQANISTADGSLSGFTLVPGSTLVTSRQNHSNVVLGNMLYVLGGWNGAYVGSVERAILQ
ncbi:MAG TPA: hypothetical protein VIA18_28875, partial [Polyangia bacterium]|nr:hypothetical protein [Polyangia bacterium]